MAGSMYMYLCKEEECDVSLLGMLRTSRELGHLLLERCPHFKGYTYMYVMHGHFLTCTTQPFLLLGVCHDLCDHPEGRVLPGPLHPAIGIVEN